MQALSREFYLRGAETVAKELLGKHLVWRNGKQELILRITETEAYLGISDPACHSYGNRRTSRTEVMYGLGGHSYIYLIYGMYNMLNAVTGEAVDPCAVLIRGGEPVEGTDAMSRNRFGVPWGELSGTQRRSLCDGPGKICKAMGLSRAHNGLDLTGSELFICAGGEIAPYQIEMGPRIGVDYAGEAAKWALNFKLYTCFTSKMSHF